jgi:hypothetical protein
VRSAAAFPLIVPPVPDKRIYGQQMIVVWDNARRMLRAADVIAVVGYSCADIDEPVNALLREAGVRKRVLIANPAVDARERAMGLVPTARFMPAVDSLTQAPKPCAVNSVHDPVQRPLLAASRTIGSRHVPVAVTEGSVTENLMKFGCGSGPIAHGEGDRLERAESRIPFGISRMGLSQI